MRLIRHGEPGAERPGVLLEGRRRDCSAHFTDWNGAFFRADGLDALRELLREVGPALPEVPAATRWAAPIARPGKTVCVGLNYADHAAESGSPIPREPVLFLKATNAVIGPCDRVRIPPRSQKTDWEVELGVIIAREARELASPEAAGGHIAGYCVSNDISERDFQHAHDGQWTKGKSADTFHPLGPWLATPDEVPDAQNLELLTEVNGERMQTGNTRTMLFSVLFLVHYISQFMTLEAGDVISTGTPPGVGMGKTPPRYLQDGDRLEAEITGLGRQRLRCYRGEDA